MAVSDPLVSIVTPCYRQGHLLGAAIDCVLTQSYPSIELVVVDDGSDDDTAAVAARYGDRVHYVYQKNGGLPVARNTGIRAATGKYLLFLDADDLLHPQAVAWLVEAMQGKEDQICVMGYCFFQGDPLMGREYVVLPQENFCAMLPSSFLFDPVLAEYAGEMPPDHLSLLPYLIYTNFGPPHCYFCPRKLVVGVGGFQERFQSRGCEDWDLWLRLAFAGARVAAVPRCGAYYRRYEGSMSTNVQRMLDNRTEVLLHLHHQLRTQPALLDRWGTDLLLAEQRVLRRYIALGLRASPFRGELRRCLHQLRGHVPAPRVSLPRRLLQAVLGDRSEHLALAYYRRFKPEIFSYYANEID